MPDCAAVILTKNEEENLPGCLVSLAGLEMEVYVVDSGSTDATLQIAKDHGAAILRNGWVDYATQFNWALDNIKTDARWILRLDADERLSTEVRDFVATRLKELPDQITGVSLKLRINFLGRWMKHGGMRGIRLIRLFRRGCGRSEVRHMDEHITLSRGQVLRLDADLLHYPVKHLDDWLIKHVHYASRECKDLLAVRERTVSQAGLDGQAGRKRWMKEKLYARIPLFLRAAMFWFSRYILQFGFLDGAEGFTYHFMQCLWYRTLVDAKVHHHLKARQ